MRDQLKDLEDLEVSHSSNSRSESESESESGILNFDVSDKQGSHWVAWYVDNNTNNFEKRPEKLYYFDSYGTAVPDELREYLSRKMCKGKCKKTNNNKKKILRSDFMIQKLNTDICGELCCTFIYLMDYQPKLSYKEVINKLVESSRISNI